jgi:chromosome segregation protein
MKTQLDDLHQAKATLRELIAELETAMHNRFLQTFNAVALEFGRYFTRLFGGGTARLQLVSRGSVISSSNGDNPAAGVPRDAPLGIEIVARPPGKRQHNLLLLSGGERALTASALLFAILSVNPSPFCVMDEVDAALDEANVGRFREALSDLTQQTQFILISHNRGTMEAAETFYGVSMGDDGVSRVLSLKVEAVLEQPAEEVLAHGP